MILMRLNAKATNNLEYNNNNIIIKLKFMNNCLICAANKLMAAIGIQFLLI